MVVWEVLEGPTENSARVHDPISRTKGEKWAEGLMAPAWAVPPRRIWPLRHRLLQTREGLPPTGSSCRDAAKAA